MKILTFSRQFPVKHPRAGQPAFFVESILTTLGFNIRTIPDIIRPYINDFAVMDGTSAKGHTIRAGDRFKPGDMVSLRVWSGKPYASKQIEFGQVEVKKTWNFDLIKDQVSVEWRINDQFKGYYTLVTASQSKNPGLFKVARNDGLLLEDFVAWFAVHPKNKDWQFHGQIICWDETIQY